jgi:hypothetical protein
VNDEQPLVRSVLPGLADRMETALRAQGEERVADQVAELRITAVCPCDQEFCGSFHTAKRPMKRWMLRGRQITLADDGPGEVSIDVVQNEVAYVEVLFVDGVRERLAGLRGQ